MDLWAAVLKLMISIHALRVEGDLGDDQSAATTTDFYPRPPGGGRLCRVVPTGGGVG